MKRLFSLLLLALSFSLFSEGRFECSMRMPHGEAFENYWTKMPEEVRENERIVDYVPTQQGSTEGEESFTIQAYQFIEDFDIRMMYDKFVSTLRENIEPAALLHHVVHHKDRKSVYFEWWVNPPYKEAQHEWIKILKDKNNKLAIVRFQSKNEIRRENEHLWIECVKHSSFLN